MPVVLQFPNRKNADVKKSLRELYEQAERDEIDGICWVVSTDAGHEAGMSGTYRNRPDVAIDTVTRAMSALYTYSARQRLNRAPHLKEACS